MPPKRTDLFHTDASDRERADLDRLLQREVANLTTAAPRVPVAVARHEKPRAEIVSERDTTRLLIISRDTALLNQATQSLDGYVQLTDVFDEVHIVVMQQGITPHNPVLRVAPAVWLYVVSGRSRWWLPVMALRMIAEQMMFADGFRPDLIVARDPYESALVAYFAGRHYNRPTQLHILDESTKRTGGSRVRESSLRRWFSRRLIARFMSIRTSTDSIADAITKRYPQIPDVATLPRFHNYEQLRTSSTERNIKDTYRQFTFVIAYCGPLDIGSKAFQVMDAVRGYLRGPKIGLVFFGDGPARKELEKRAQILGITTQIAFERENTAMTQYLSSVDVLVVPEDTTVADEVAIMGAFAHVPLVAVATPLRSDLFLHGESALLCGVDDVMTMTAHINRLVNDVNFRQTLADKAYAIVATRLHEDPEAYKLAYRDSVEAALFVGESEEEEVMKE